MLRSDEPKSVSPSSFFLNVLQNQRYQSICVNIAIDSLGDASMKGELSSRRILFFHQFMVELLVVICSLLITTL